MSALTSSKLAGPARVLTRNSAIRNPNGVVKMPLRWPVQGADGVVEILNHVTGGKLP
jgi:hypothetical protein